MPGTVLSSCLVILTLAGLGFGWWAGRQARAARAEMAAMRDGTAAAERSLGLLAQEMQATGLTMLGHAGPSHAASGPDAAAATSSIAEAAHRVLALADDLTELLALRCRQRTVHAQPMRLLPVLEDAVAAAAAQLGPARRDWRLAPDCARIALRADARAMRGALEQVLARAARLTRDGDWIGVRPLVSEDSITILIEDEGAGIGAADGGPRAGVEPAVARTRGLGFGLAVARALLEAHGGSLRIEALQGVGTRAWLILPRDRLLQG